MIRKLISLMVILSLLLFAGCGSKTDEQNKPKTETQSTAESQNSSNNQAQNSQSETSNSNDKISVTQGTTNSAKLPKEYPSDKFPIYDGSFISTVTELDGSYVLTAFSKDDVKKVIAFYNKVLEGAKVQMDTKTDESLTSFGTKSGYTYNLDVGKSSEMEGYQTIITISLQPQK
ncbi:hypothetical protein FDN13_10625 [Caloramator sp. E03]|uniref:hypothetical protein n=1 Tax=Caloramator sp. E03 TaxID=2576307 RepID=UPI001110A519|nr:hypothetical protein [Caloramator sp. E03]QCX34124.1 hypothetical protein FDN13_10625 [Caloramator sp. E03]